MKPRDLALVIASDLAAAPEERFPLDRIRMQKALFMATQRGPKPWRTFFDYRPYNWGPYSSQLAGDLDVMSHDDLLRCERQPDWRHPKYATTASGESEAARIWMAMDPGERAFLRQVRAYVTSRSFTELLREVYAAYPEYAVASRFTG